MSLPTGERSPAERWSMGPPRWNGWPWLGSTEQDGTEVKAGSVTLTWLHRDVVGLGHAHSWVYIPLLHSTLPNPSHLQQCPFPAIWDDISITPSPSIHVHAVLQGVITHSIVPVFPPHFCNTTQVPVTLINEDSQFSWSIIHLLTFTQRQLKDPSFFSAWCLY